MIEMTVDLRFSNVDPPASEPKRSIYADLVNLPDPVYLGLTVRIFNYDDVGLYMRVDGYGTGWTFATNNLGLLASGANMYRNLDNLGSRAKPASAVSETITVRLRAYTDSGYTNLKWTFERVIDMVFIKSDDGSWTQDFINNFDDGTVQGWAVVNEANNESPYPTISVVTDYVLSTPYSVQMLQRCWSGGGYGSARARIYKAFTTPNRNNVYAIADIRLALGPEDPSDCWLKYVEARNQGVATLIFLGRPADTVSAQYLPYDKWMRLVFPLPRNTTLTVGIALHYLGTDAIGRVQSRLWMDDFRIISKD